MKQRPILFSTPMVKAILEGRKTQTRRVKGLEFLKDYPTAIYVGNSKERNDVPRPAIKYDQSVWYWWFTKPYSQGDFVAKCPYGKIGDVLWVRETWCRSLDEEGDYLYRATEPDADDGDGGSPWKPSIHMPKAAARIWLKITDVRVERLQDISEQDAKAEGVEYRKADKVTHTGYIDYQKKDGMSFYAAYHSFISLWRSINGIESWKENPWVWVVSFQKIYKPE